MEIAKLLVGNRSKLLVKGSVFLLFAGFFVLTMVVTKAGAETSTVTEQDLGTQNADSEVELDIRAIQKKMMQEGMQQKKMQEVIQEMMQVKVQEKIDAASSFPKRVQPDQMQQEVQSTMRPKLQGMMQQKAGVTVGSGPPSTPPEGNKKYIFSSLPQSILAKQHSQQVLMPDIEEAIMLVLKVGRETAAPLIDREFHNNGAIITVPDQHKSIQAAIDAAQSGDTVLVKAGTYFEQLTMKDGVKLVSDSADQGDELVAVAGAVIKLPSRALRTIIDGTKAKPSKHGMIDFNPGVERKTIIDGFTIQNLPHQDHHVPGHAHGLNVRGASPIITNCLIRNMGSTGIGNHVVYNDQESSVPSRDFRWQNIKNFSSPVIYNNIVHSSVGLGIGCNHFSTPIVLANEVYNNDDSEVSGSPSPGIGNKHGSAATIIGNIVHDNPGGGIQCKVGDPQGMYNIDRPTHPSIVQNVIYDNGMEKAAISSQGAGSLETPVIISGNYVFNSGAAGIGLMDGAVAIIEDNMVANSKDPGIAVKSSTVLKLNGNGVDGMVDTPGILLVNKTVVHEMLANTVTPGDQPPFMLKDDSSIMEKAAKVVE
nr:right-handed parallel beta-helix repeat-containing protein [Desulfobulbaceae bacterium]